MAIKKINNEVYNFKLGFNALIEFEELSGVKLSDEEKELGLTEVRTLFYVALKGANPKGEVTLLGAGDLIERYINEQGIDEVMKFLEDLISESLGKMNSRQNLEKVIN